MRCLLLGGGGFQGSHLSDILVDSGHSVRIFEKRNASKKNVMHLLDRIEWIEGDFVVPEHLHDALNGVDVVFHLVSTTLPRSSNEDTVYDINTNLIPTLHLLEASRKLKVKKIIFFSSGGTVYGIPKSIPINEEHPTNPICSYGIQKLAIEKYLKLYHHLYDLDYAVLRISNPYGERQLPTGSQGAVAVFAYKALKNEPIEIWGDGLVTRDYVHVSDVARAAMTLLSYQGKYKIFNIGSGIGISLLDVVKVIEKIMGKKLGINFLSARALDVPINILDIGLATHELSWNPEIRFDRGLQQTIKWFSSRV